jgi:Cysteine-rich secretory protein family
MRYNIFRSRFSRLALLMLLIAGTMSISSLPQPARAGQDTITYLPIVMRDSIGGTPLPPLPTGPAEQQALDRLNYYRRLAGTPLLQLHPALVTAAQNHVTYLDLNINDDSANVYWPHGEVEAKPGYTGHWSGDRAVATGYPRSAGWEVISFDNDPIVSVDNLIATVFHRVTMLDPYLEYMGYGHGPVGSGGADVIDFGHGTSSTNRQQVIVYPVDGQTNVPVLWLGGETPSPLPPDAPPSAVGFPITIQPSAYVALNVTQAELHDSSRAPIAVYPNSSNCGTACYAIIPVNPLQKAMVYTVHVAGAVDGAPFEQTWAFTTVN